MKLLVDLSSVLGAYLHLTDDEFGEDVKFEGKNVFIPSVHTSMERFKYTISNLSVPVKDFIVVKDPKGPVVNRVRILKDYKKKPVTKPRKFFKVRDELIAEATTWLKSEGAIIATPKNSAEADDLINQLAIRLPNTIIWTRDKDLLACPTMVILQGKDGPEVDPERFPVEDKYIHVYRTIVLGDKSDNVGSCKGFGEKAWDKMIDLFGDEAIKDLDEMLRDKQLFMLKDHVAAFPKFQLIVDQAAELYKIYKVLNFLPVPAHEVKWEGGMIVGSKTLVTTDNFQEVYDFIKTAEYEYSVMDYEADTDDESKAWCEIADVKVDVLSQEITGMGLRITAKNFYLPMNFYFSVDHKDTDNITLEQLESVLELIWGKEIFAHNTAFENTLTYTHFEALLPNMTDTMLMASYVDERDFMGLKHLSKRWLGYTQTSYEETLNGRSGMREVTGLEVMDYGIDDVITTDGLKRLFTVIMQYEDTLDVFYKVEGDSLYFTTMCFINGVDFDAEQHAELKAENDANIIKAWRVLSGDLLRLGWEGGEIKPIKSLNIATVNKLHKAVNGFELEDITAVKEAIRVMKDRELASLIESKDYPKINELYEKHWRPEAEFNVRSPNQMSKLLYELLNCPIRLRNKPTANMIKAGKPGNPCSNEDAVKNAIAYGDTPHVKLLDALIVYKGYLTKESLFFAKWPKYVHPKTGKIHCSMRQSATTTRRFTHAKPNMAQLPKKKGKEVRNMMTVPSYDWYIWALDVDSQELKLQAWDSQDPNFLACYLGKIKKDVHGLTGYEVALKQGIRFGSYEKFMEKLEKEENATKFTYKGSAKSFRFVGKTTNFSTAYLCRAPTLAAKLCVTNESAQDFIDAKDLAFPGLMKRVRRYISKCSIRGYARTFLGARRHLHGHQNFGSHKMFEREAAGRLAWSFRIQGSGAEQIKLSAGRMYREGLFDDGLCQPITIIHDELVGRIHKSVLAERMPKLYAAVCQPYADMGIETSSTPKIGSHFGSLKSYEMV